jgi:DNA-binding response OmpR family regulator
MPTVLVVDDNAKIVEVLTEYLGSEGFSTLSASNGTDALALLDSAPPDLALLDIMLPGVDGLELTKRFEARGVPVILVTARAEEIDRLLGLQLGADDYITKPFSPREVVARVKAVLRRCARAEQPSAVLTVGDLSIDPEQRSVTVGDTPVELTRSEFDLLALMAASPGRVYSRLQLLEAISGDAFDGYERTIDAHVKNIRRKLGEDSRDPRHVRTVFGVGYKVVG